MGLLTICGGHDDGSHEQGVFDIGALPVQHHSAGPDLPRAAVDVVEGVCWTNTVHHCAILTIVRVCCQNLGRGTRGVGEDITGEKREMEREEQIEEDEETVGGKTKHREEGKKRRGGEKGTKREKE